MLLKLIQAFGRTQTNMFLVIPERWDIARSSKQTETTPTCPSQYATFWSTVEQKRVLFIIFKW